MKNPVPLLTATAIAHPNIALIKYWGNRDETLNLPSNGSISINLGSLETRTTVTFDPTLHLDTLTINQLPASRDAVQRVSNVLNRIRQLAGISAHAQVESELNFPMGTGIASSAAGFAALAMAATHAAGLSLSEMEISCLARLGSGSACRSVPGGFVEWLPGTSDETSYAVTIAQPEAWDLQDVIVVLQNQPKQVGSREGHALANTSPLQAARIADAPRRLEICRQAILQRDFAQLADIIELDSNMMHAVMKTSSPPLHYATASTNAIIQAVPEWRATGIQVAFTLDAGPNVHLICTPQDVDRVKSLVLEVTKPVDILVSGMGGPARIIRTV